MNFFTSLGLAPELVKAIDEAGYDTPTPIQDAAIPKVLAGKDIMAAAQTGTGKTAAFMLPSLERLRRFANNSASPAMHPVRMLVLTPTRELADQIDVNIKQYCKYLLLRHTVIFGGTNIAPQTQTLREGVEIVVATPGRLLDHVGQKNINLGKVDILVLDEADRMLDMGFITDVRKIIEELPKKRQILLFSATFAPEIQKLANDFMHQPEKIEVARQNTTSENIEQHILAVDSYRKKYLLHDLITDLNIAQVIVFCKTKQSVDQVARDLKRKEIAAEAIHGDKNQSQRTETLSAFKEGLIKVLVATDVAARGLDIAELPFVINYELPTNPEDYIHRIGRTGRAGAEGVAISLMDQSEHKMFEAILELTKQSLKIERVEGFEPRWLDENGQVLEEGQYNTKFEENRKNQNKSTPQRKRDVGGSALTRGNKQSRDEQASSFCDRIEGRPPRKQADKNKPALFYALADR